MKIELQKNKNFKILVSTDLFTKLSDSMDNIVLTLLAIELTGSSMSTGLLLAIASIPGVLFSLLGGGLSDIKNQKSIIFAMTFFQAMLLIVVAITIKLQMINFIILCSALFILESFSRFYSPAFNSATIQAVPKEDYKQAISIISTAGSLVQMLGASISAVLVSTLGYFSSLIINSFGYFLASIGIKKLTLTRVQDGNEAVPARELLKKIKQGLVYTFSTRSILLTIVFIATFNFILAWFDVSLPFLLIEHIRTPITSLGYIKSASTFAFVVAGFYMISKDISPDSYGIPVSIFVVGISILAMSFTQFLVLAVILWGLAAFFRTIASLLLMSKLAVQIHGEMTGRVFGFVAFISSISMLISRLVSAALVHYLGSATTFQVAGIAFCILAGFFFLSIRDAKAHYPV